MNKTATNFIRSLKSTEISQKNIGLMYLVNFFSLLRFVMPVWVLFLTNLLPSSQIALLSSWLFAAVLFLELPTGAFADLFGKKATIISGLVISGISYIFYPLLTELWQFFIIFSMQASGEALVSGAKEALVFDSLKQDGKESTFRSVYGNFMLFIQLAFVGATLSGGWIFSIDYRLPFWLYAGSIGVSVLLALELVEPDVDTQKFTLKNYFNQTKDGFLQLTKNKWVLQLSGLYVLVGGISWVFQRMVNLLFLEELGYTAITIGIVLGSIRLFNILALKKIVTLRWLKETGYDILLLPILMLISYIPGFWIGKSLAFPIIMGTMIVATGRFMVLNPYVNEAIDSSHRATALSALNMLVSLVLIISMAASGPLLDLYGGGFVLTLFGFVSLLTVVPLSLVVFKRRKKYLQG